MTANRCLAIISHMFTMAAYWGVLVARYRNPCRDIARYPTTKRNRFLSPADLTRLEAVLAAAEEVARRPRRLRTGVLALDPYIVAALRLLDPHWSPARASGCAAA